jgi:hypothetical protein
LKGYDLERTQAADPVADLQVARPGETLDYTLYWQAKKPPTVNYHGFVHLVDLAGQTIDTQDHLAGSFFRAPMLWDTFTLQPDRYQVAIPETTPNGLYTPEIGLYDFTTLERLQTSGATGEPLGDSYRLPAVKVLGRNPKVTPQHSIDARLGDSIALLGYDLSLPEAALQPGSTYSLTLYYRSLAPEPQDLTQFVHLYDAERGMASQHDSPPQRGANPTWAWVPGEIIVDTIAMKVDPKAAPGTYSLRVGMYNPVDGARLPVRNKSGDLLQDGQIPLTELTIYP